MATIRVDTRKTRNFSSDFLELSKRVEKDAKTVSAATTKLDKTVKAKGKISADLESLRKSLEEIAKALQNASVFTTESAQELAKAETKSVQMAAAAAGIAAGTAASVSAAKSGASQPQQSSAQKSKADVPVSQTVVAETRNSAAAKIKEGVKAEINHVQELPQSGHTPIPIVDVPLGMRAPALATAEVNRDKPDIKIASHRETAAPQTGVTIGAHRLGSEDVAAEAGQKSDVVIGSHRETPIQNLKTDVVIGSHRETASTGSKPGITIGSHRETQGTAPKPGITIGSHRETSDSGAAEEKPKSDIKIGAHRETSEENPKSSAEEKPKSGITIGSHREATDAKKPETIKDKINAKLSGLDASAKKYLEENKDNLIGKAKQSGAALGISTLGSGLGKGISYGAEKLGITGGSAAASADFEATGLEASTVHVDGDTTAIASAKLGEVKASANASATFDPAGGNINASANANFSATAAKAGASYKNSFASLSAEAMVGAVSGNASIDASLMKSGKFNPAVSANVNASASAAKAVVSAEVQKDGYLASGRAEGTVGSASASASAIFDPGSGKAWAGAGAMAAAAKGTVQGTADLGPVKVSGKVTGYAGAAGAEIGIGLEDGQLKFRAGAALGAGVSTEIGIGVGNWLPKLDKALDGAVGEGLSAVSSAASVVMAPVGAVVATAKNAVESVKDIGKGIASGDAKAALAGVGKLVTGTGEAIYNAGKTVVQGVGNAVVSAGKAIGSVASKVGEGIAYAFTHW